MTQIATVEKKLEPGFVEISVPRKSACGHDCEECTGCGMTGAAIHARASDPVGVNPGDKVVVRPQSTADDGQIVVARLEDEATVKRLHRRNGKIWLLPENDAYDPIDGTRAEIIGVVKAVVREY